MPVLAPQTSGEEFAGAEPLRGFLRRPNAMTKRLKHQTDVTVPNRWIAGLFMPPLKIVVIARRTHRIEKQANRAYMLR